MEEVEKFNYLGMWIDRALKGNVQIEKISMQEKADRWSNSFEWMARVDGRLEAE